MLHLDLTKLFDSNEDGDPPALEVTKTVGDKPESEMDNGESNRSNLESMTDSKLEESIASRKSTYGKYICMEEERIKKSLDIDWNKLLDRYKKSNYEKYARNLPDKGQIMKDAIRSLELEKERRERNRWMMKDNSESEMPAQSKISCIKVFGRNMDEQELMARLMAKKEAEKEKKGKSKKRKNEFAPLQSETGADRTEEPTADLPSRNPEKSPIILDSEPEQPSKCHQPNRTIPGMRSMHDKPILTADKAIVNLGRSITDSFPHVPELNRLMKNRTAFQGEQAIAFLTQALAWTKSASASAVLDEFNIKKLEQAADKAEDRATDLQNKWSAADEELERVKKKLADAQESIQTLRQDIRDRDERLAAAEAKMEEAAEQVADSQTTYYGRGMFKRLRLTMAVEASRSWPGIQEDSSPD